MWVTRSKAREVAVRKEGSWATSLLAIALVLSGAGVVTGGVWLSIQMFVNPDACLDKSAVTEWRKPLTPGLPNPHPNSSEPEPGGTDRRTSALGD